MTPDQLLNAISEDRLIEGVTFKGDNWLDIDLSSGQFRNCIFSDISFEKAVFEDAHFKKCSFKNCSFTHGRLEHASFEDCIFFDSDKGAGTDFSYADLQGVRFENCNLSTAIFRATNMFEARILNCMAQGARFEDTLFSHAIGGSRKHVRTDIYITDSNLDFANLQNGTFEGCTLSRCSMRESNLSSCDFTNADLSNSDLSNADMTKACFKGTNLYGSTLSGMTLGTLSGFNNMRVDESQQTSLLEGLGINVLP